MMLFIQLFFLYVVLLAGYLFWLSPLLGLFFVALLAFIILLKASPRVFFFVLGMFFGFRR